jgi:hypothetical protein
MSEAIQRFTPWTRVLGPSRLGSTKATTETHCLPLWIVLAFHVYVMCVTFFFTCQHAVKNNIVGVDQKNQNLPVL